MPLVKKQVRLGGEQQRPEFIRATNRNLSVKTALRINTHAQTTMPRAATKMAFQMLETGHSNKHSNKDVPEASSNARHNFLHLPTLSEVSSDEREPRLSDSSSSCGSASSQEDFSHTSGKAGPHYLLASMLSRRALARSERKR